MSRNNANRVSLAPEFGAGSQVYELPANGAAGTAENLMEKLQAAATAANKDLKPGSISGILISVRATASVSVFLRTSLLNAAATLHGIEIQAGENLYIPSPHGMDDPLLYEANAPLFVMVFY